MAPQITEAANRKVDEEQAKTVKRNPVPASATTPGRSTPDRDQLGKRVEKLCKWALNVAVLAAAIVFGIWAPLSYNITLKGNSGNDASSSSMLSGVLAASSQASVAASKQSAILDDMGSRMGAIGQLRLVEFCATQATISACQKVISEINVPSLITYLASTTFTPGSTTSSASSTTAVTGIPNPPTSSSNPVPKGSQLSVPAILGIVFAVLVVVGWLFGVYLFLSRRHKTADEVET